MRGRTFVVDLVMFLRRLICGQLVGKSLEVELLCSLQSFLVEQYLSQEYLDFVLTFWLFEMLVCDESAWSCLQESEPS